MMVKDTSLKCYLEIQEEGIKDSATERVYEAIKRSPHPMTGREIAVLMLETPDMNVVRPRITEMAQLGTIVEAGKRPCTLSGRTSYTWEIKHR